MRLEAYQVAVEPDHEEIIITQVGYCDDDEGSRVTITVEQVDLFIEFIEEARLAIETKREADGEAERMAKLASKIGAFERNVRMSQPNGVGQF